MTTVPEDALESFARRAVSAFGADEEAAGAVAASLVRADLVGHSSHGVVRLPAYASLVEEGSVDPTARPTVQPVGGAGASDAGGAGGATGGGDSRDRGAPGPFARLVGGAAFGQVVGRRAVELLVEGATEHGVAVVGVRDSGHLGRVGEWAERVADAGCLFAGWVNLQGGAQRVGPPGSADRRLGTNPVTQAVPTFDALAFPLVYDGATSQVAHGKILERDGSGERLPAEWTLTRSGAAVERASAFEDGAGALLPLGGRAAGYKGFGLATMAELFAGIVGDGPVAEEARQEWTGNGAAFVALDPTAFTTREAVVERVAGLAAHLRSAESVDGEEVLLPGEPEHRTAERHREKGVPVDETTADRLRAVADEYDLALPAGLA